MTRFPPSTQINAVGFRFAGDKTTLATTISTAGDNTLIAPELGQRTRLYWLGMATSQDNSDEVLVTAKFGATTIYKWPLGNPGAFSHWEPVEGEEDEPLVINLSTAQPVHVNYTYELV